MPVILVAWSDRVPASCPRCRRLVMLASSGRPYDPSPKLHAALIDRIVISEWTTEGYYADNQWPFQSFASCGAGRHVCPPPLSSGRVGAIAAQLLSTADPADQARLLAWLYSRNSGDDVERVLDALLLGESFPEPEDDLVASWNLPGASAGKEADDGEDE